MLEINDDTVKQLFGNESFVNQLQTYVESCALMVRRDTNEDERDGYALNELVTEINSQFIQSINYEVEKKCLELSSQIEQKNSLIL